MCISDQIAEASETGQRLQKAERYDRKMEQIRQTIARPKRYGFLAVIWILVLAAVAMAAYVLFPPSQHDIIEDYSVSDAHRPAEAYRYLRCQAKMEACQPYLADLEEGEFQAVFLAMYSLENYVQEDFAVYRGIPTMKMEPSLDNAMELLELLGMLEELLEEGLPIERIYLGLDPVKLEQHLSWEEELDWQGTIAALLQEHEEIQWEVLLAYPSLQEWLQLPEQEQRQAEAAYERAMEALTAVEQLQLYYPGGQEWLICNQDNYAGEGMLNASVSHNLLLKVFCDRNYLITRDNREAALEELKETLELWRYEAPYVKRQEGYTLVFLGDSIIGNYTDSLSVPGVVKNFTGAQCINCGYGGLCLSKEDSGIAGVDVINALIQGSAQELPENVPAWEGIQELSRMEVSADRLVFFLNYGINDYMLGHPVESADAYAVTTYKGAMRTAVEQLQEAYPGAQIVIMTPTFISYYEYGTQRLSDAGGIMTDYVEAAAAVAGEYGLPCMNNYVDMEVNEENEKELLADGCHPNEKGRLRMGLLICRRLNDLLP